MKLQKSRNWNSSPPKLKKMHCEFLAKQKILESVNDPISLEKIKIVPRESTKSKTTPCKFTHKMIKGTKTESWSLSSQGVVGTSFIVLTHDKTNIATLAW